MLLLTLAAPAFAVLPLPVQPDCAEDALDKCPNELGHDDWDMTSWIPTLSRSTVRPVELPLGSGIAADKAWRLTTGRFDVPIAIIDTGAEWGRDSIARKIMLNTAELPMPQDASGATHDTYDLDGNGIVNVSDYAQDPRVLITAGNDSADNILDPSDLIYTFSDGIDQDGNGFIDDIAGWDFFENDNDVWPHVRDNYSSHGSGVMEDAAAEGGDGGSIGVCPNCSILPLRSGDGIITDGDRVGMAIAYATDRGAKVVGMALGSLSQSNITDAAIAYADKHGVLLISVAGDENSYHHNFPAVKAPILFVHAVRSDVDGTNGTFTFMSLFGCNNYGPRVDVVAAASGCATGSNAKTSGAAGLIVSAGLDAGTPLATDEIRALFRGTTDDIAFTADDLAKHPTYPGGEGWDPYYGHGRINVGRAVEHVFAGEIPPIARITSPAWYDWEKGTVDVTGHIDAPRSTGVSWTLSVGQGLDPQTWDQVANGNQPVDGTIATVDLSAFGKTAFGDLHGEGVVARTERAHEPLVTLKLDVTDAGGRTSEERRGFWVQDDPDRFAGFPIVPGGSLESSPQLADLDGDGDYEIIAATGDGHVHAYQQDGSELPGFPVATDVIPALAAHYHASAAYTSGEVPGDAREGIIAAPAVGDIDGDGEVDIIAASIRGGVYAWHTDGTPVAGFPVRIQGHTPEEFTANHAWDEGVLASPALADVDGDGTLDLIVAGEDQRLDVWRGDGTLLDGYPLTLCQPSACETSGRRIISSPAIGDFDGDGDLDAALGTNEVPVGAAGLLYVVDLTTASIWPDYPIRRDGLVNQQILPVIGEGSPSAVAAMALDGDGTDEVFQNAMLGAIGPVSAISDPPGAEVLDLSFYRDGFGAHTSLATENSFVSMVTNPSVGDLDGDGVPDLVLGGAGVYYLLSLASNNLTEYEHAVAAWSGATGAMFSGFPRAVDDTAFLNAASIADVTGDTRPEVIYGTGGFFLYAWNSDGTIAPGWPKFTGGWILGAPAVGDIDGDGLEDVVVSTREGFLFAWHTKGRADQDVQWQSMRHDPQNTGNYGTALAVQAGPAEVDAGCCHKKHDTDPAQAAWIALLAPWLLRRRTAEATMQRGRS